MAASENMRPSAPPADASASDPEPLLWMHTFWRKTFPQLAASVPREVESLPVPYNPILTRENVVHIAGLLVLRDTFAVFKMKDAEIQDDTPQGLAVPTGWEETVKVPSATVDVLWTKGRSSVGVTYVVEKPDKPESGKEGVFMEYIKGARSRPNVLRSMSIETEFFPVGSCPAVMMTAEYHTPKQGLIFTAEIHETPEGELAKSEFNVGVVD